MRKSEIKSAGPSQRAAERLGQYFNQGTIARAYPIVNNYVERRVRNFLRQWHKHSTVGTRRFSWQVIFGELGVVSMRPESWLGGLRSAWWRV